jgi:branched-subunit amino acid transport protein
MTAWLVVLGAGACTYLLRISMVVVLANRDLPRPLAARLHLVAPAVLAGLVASALFVSDSSVHRPPFGHLAAITVAGLVVRRTGAMVHGLVVGLAVAALAELVGIR